MAKRSGRILMVPVQAQLAAQLVRDVSICSCRLRLILEVARLHLVVAVLVTPPLLCRYRQLNDAFLGKLRFGALSSPESKMQLFAIIGCGAGKTFPMALAALLEAPAIAAAFRAVSICSPTVRLMLVVVIMHLALAVLATVPLLCSYRQASAELLGT